MGENLLETLREIFKDQRIHLSLALIEKLELADDRSFLNVLVNLVPDELTIVAQMTWQQVGPNAGIYGFPVVGDSVIVAFMEGDEDSAYVVSRLSSKIDKIPEQAINGDTVMRALAGNRTHILSDTEVLIGRGGSDPTEPLVLGHTFRDAYSEHLDIDSRHQHIGNFGYNTYIPNETGEYQAIKASPVDDDVMLSDLSKTEK